MKKTILLSLLLMLAIGAYSQQWVYSCSSNNSIYYVYSKCRNVAPNQYIVHVQESHKDLYQERKNLAEKLEDNNKYRNFFYSKIITFIILIIVIISKYIIILNVILSK